MTDSTATVERRARVLEVVFGAGVCRGCTKAGYVTEPVEGMPGSFEGICRGCWEHRMDLHAPVWSAAWGSWCHYEPGVVKLGEMDGVQKRAWRVMARQWDRQVYEVGSDGRARGWRRGEG